MNRHTKHHSVVQRLNICLILTVLIVATISVSITYYIAVGKARSELASKADETADYFARMLSIPMWNIDTLTIHAYGDFLMLDEFIVGLKITGMNIRTRFEKEKERIPVFATLYRKIYYHEEPIGEMVLSVSRMPYQRRINDFLLSSIATIAFILFSIVISTRFFIRLFLKAPLKVMMSVVNTYAAGKYDAPLPDIPYSEFQAVEAVLRNMGQRIVDHMANLQLSEKKYRLLAENATDVICVWGLKGELSFISPSVTQLIGFSSDEVITQPLQRFLTTESLKKLQAQQKTLEEGGDDNPLRLEIELRCKAGNTVWTEMVAKKMAGPGGEKIGTLGIFRDIRERKLAEKEKSKLEMQLRRVQKLEAIGTLANGIAHDFNNILSCILGYTELAKVGLDGRDEIAKDLDEVIKAGTRARDLVKQILAFSRHTTAVRKPVLIAPLIKEALKFLQASLPSTIEIVTHIREPQGAALADPTQLHQIFMNLCTNAAYAMKDKGGILTICLEKMSPSEGETTALKREKDKEYIRISVKDNGHGIRKENLDRIFDPFFTTKPREEGTGMGLSVVHGIVKDMGGEIAVESEVGKGTAMHILLPKCKEEVVDEFPSEIVATGKGRILLVDDEEGVVSVHREILMLNGYEVTATTSSSKALTYFENDPHGFDLVLTDMTMPKITGLELAARMNSINPRIPILLCTGFGNALTDEMIARSGVRQVIMKPLIARELINAIDDALNPETKGG